MKRTLLILCLGLALSLLSASAWATPSHEGKAPKELSTRADDLDLSLSSHKSHASKKPAKSHASKKPAKSHTKKVRVATERVDIQELGGESTGPSVASAVPEPSALLLFGVGCLVARRAIFRARR